MHCGKRAAIEKECSKRMARARIAKLIAGTGREQAPLSREVANSTIALTAAGADAVDMLAGEPRTYTIPLPSFSAHSTGY
jgi:hypothetical protein